MTGFSQEVKSKQDISEKTEQEIICTTYYEFHNNFWLNLHHFLYQKAKGSQSKRLQKRGETLLSIGEDLVYTKLSAQESELLNKAITYYKDTIIKKDLLRDLRHMQLWFQDLNEHKKIIDMSFGVEFTNILNSFSEVYRLRFWEIHKSHNIKIMQKHLKTIEALESGVIQKIQVLAKYPWPTNVKARIDLLAYSNYAGAYTITEPQLNIFISTLNPDAETLLFIEIVFHEGTHTLFRYKDSPFRNEIFLKSKKLGLNHPRNLWHACLFYISGRTIQDIFKDKKIDENYNFYLDRRNVFKKFNTSIFREILERYYQKEIDYKIAINELLLNLK